MSDIIYELPLHEQTRVLIRLEFLLDRLHGHLKKSNQEAIYLALRTLDEILSIIERCNLKKYLLNEIKDASKSLIHWREHSLASIDKIDHLLNQLNTEKTFIESTSSRARDLFADNEFLKVFRQKCNVPGGTAPVDFPRFHNWLHQDPKNLQKSLKAWTNKLECYYRPIKLVLSLVRQSASHSQQIAEEGFYQKALDKNVEYKLIRIKLTDNCPCFAEISGGRYHITVRMMHEAEDGSLSQYREGVKFLLETCKI